MPASFPFRQFVLSAVLIVSGPLSKAGTITFTDTTTGTASISTYTPLVPFLTPGCGDFAGIYDHCTARLEVDTFGGSTAAVQIVDDNTGFTQNYPTSQADTFVRSDEFLDPNKPGNYGLDAEAAFSDPVGSVATLAFDFFDYQGYSDSGTCYSCVGTITGNVQQAFTVNYLDAGNNILGSDVISFQGQQPTIPEPGTILTMLSGFTLLGIGALRRSLRAL